MTTCERLLQMTQDFPYNNFIFGCYECMMFHEVNPPSYRAELHRNMPHFNAPVISNLNQFFSTVYRGTFSALIIFSFLFALMAIDKLLCRSHTNKIYHTIATALAIGVTIAPIVYWNTPGSMAMINLAIAFVMTATIFILNFRKLLPLDYAVLFSCFTFISRFVGLSATLANLQLGIALSALYVFLAVLLAHKIRHKQLKGNVFYIWFICVFVFAIGYAATFLFNRYVLTLGQAQNSRIDALLVWGLAMLIIIIMCAAIVYGLKRLLEKHFDNINKMGKAYPQIERFFIYNSFAILISIGFLHHYYGTMPGVVAWNNPVLGVFNLLLLLAMALQLSFLIMVFRITWLKDNLKNKTLETQNLAVYSSNLEKNIDDIKHIKHDIKNIFLTMGNFVEESGHSEMQEFYRTKISPFAGEEIAKSDLYGKLAGIGNEQLKAFLFYKISQAIERDVSVNLDVSGQIPFTNIPLEFIELVRILGILLDNAIEECMEIRSDFRDPIDIKISQNNEMLSIIIKNTVRQEIKEKGIRPGVSTKSSSRGKGLITVQSIIEKYSHLALNSYFQDNNFVQSLVIYSQENLK